MSEIELTIDDALATITVNIPPQNRFTETSVAQFDAALAEIEKGEARAVLVRAEGADFCDGAHTDAWVGETDRQRYEYFANVMRVYNRFEQLPVPTVAAVQGIAASLGVELAVRADVVFAGKSARFKHAEAQVGIATMIGGVHRMAERVGRTKAIEWAYTGGETPADEMLQFGVVNWVVADDELRTKALEFARKLSKGATLAYVAHKRLLRIWAAAGIDAADQATLGIALPLFHTHDAKVGVQGAADARANHEAGAPRWVFEGN